LKSPAGEAKRGGKLLKPMGIDKSYLRKKTVGKRKVNTG